MHYFISYKTGDIRYLNGILKLEQITTALAYTLSSNTSTLNSNLFINGNLSVSGITDLSNTNIWKFIC